MQAFQRRELSTGSLVRVPVFYPFSGPDALMVTVFFPRNPTYVMVGLEPAGTLPKARQIERKNLESWLAAVRTTLASELSRSFFITRQMDRQFRGQVTDGLFLPILEFWCVRAIPFWASATCDWTMPATSWSGPRITKR
jgi:hypothetical protein